MTLPSRATWTLYASFEYRFFNTLLLFDSLSTLVSVELMDDDDSKSLLFELLIDDKDSCLVTLSSEYNSLKLTLLELFAIMMINLFRFCVFTVFVIVQYQC